jgi:hypothetical protein
MYVSDENYSQSVISLFYMKCDSVKMYTKNEANVNVKRCSNGRIHKNHVFSLEFNLRFGGDFPVKTLSVIDNRFTCYGINLI